MFNFFSRQKYVVGLEIKRSEIRFVELLKNSKEDRITAYGEVTGSEDFFDENDFVDDVSLSKHLSEIKKNTHTNNCVVSLPDEQVKFLRLNFKDINGKNIMGRIEDFLRENQAIGFDEEVFYSESRKKQKGISEYDILIAKKRVLRAYKKVFRASGFKIKKFMIPGFALINSSVPRNSLSSVMVIFADRKTSNIVIYDGDNAPLFHNSDSANHSIISNLNRVYMDWYDEKKQKIDHVLLLGVRANEQGFLDYISRESRIPMIRGGIFVNLETFKENVPAISKEDSYRYAVAMGLALGAP